MSVSRFKGGIGSEQEDELAQPDNRKREPPKKNLNPLQMGIQTFLQNHISSSRLSAGELHFSTTVASLPKRFTVYRPLLLLPANVFTHPPEWASIYRSLDDDERRQLYASIATSFSSSGVTHMAMNAPIQLIHPEGGSENRMRSPTGLVPLHGDFGPCRRPEEEKEEDIFVQADTQTQPCKEDFDAAFWVSTVQNGGIVQTWAPLYTMFSRGNITEKARILGHGARFEGLDDSSLKGQSIHDTSVLDMYAGIGYFVFSYLKRGVQRVWSWEINGWSVEGLRRGCLKNGWGCKVIYVRADGSIEGGLESLVDEMKDTDRVVIFHGDNTFAAKILNAIRPMLEEKGSWHRIRHANLGLLPTSQPAWEDALKLVDRQYGGWVHVHENVDIHQIDAKKEAIVSDFRKITATLNDTVPDRVSIFCDHVEQVKTYAPGVMHCVFDVEIAF